jgi:hypothetical protein
MPAVQSTAKGSSYEAKPVAGRVLIVHDTPTNTFFSELELDQAIQFHQQLGDAIGGARSLPRSLGNLLAGLNALKAKRSERPNG